LLADLNNLYVASAQTAIQRQDVGEPARTMTFMITEPIRIAAAAGSLWNRVRFQLSVGLLVSVFLPYLVRVWLEGSQREMSSLQNSLIGTGAALLLGYYGFRRSSHYPGVMKSASILSFFGTSYASVIVVFLFARLDYSRAHFAASFLLCIVWSYLVFFKLSRQTSLKMGIVPFGDVAELASIRDINWIPLQGTRGEIGTLDAVVADLRADIPDRWERYLADCALAGVLVLHVKQVVESLTGCVRIDHLSENNLGSLIPGVVYGKVKRLLDLATALLSLPLVAPVLITAGILIRLDSRGPILFRQRRIGYRGHVFTVFKLRTMQDCAAAQDDRNAAITRNNDDRVTSIGRILRRYRIDELPQIINIMRGEMSWIGPRPEAEPLSLWYENELPFYRYRHIVRPGITGWAQVNQGHVAEVDEVLGKLHYDFYYVKNFSFWLDFLIVTRTVKTVLSGFGAR
jgi:lipopolysaccharide/colanic/teichoic acid biosynthesis glycosyltransferase